MQGRTGDGVESIVGKIVEDWFLILGKLGKGGGGSCFKAVDKKNDDQFICLKIIENSDAAGMIDIFKLEIDTLLALSSPFIVEVYDSFWLNNGEGWLCYSMELCEFGDLKDVIEEWNQL